MGLVIFDFDGTIADSLGIFITAFNRLAGEFGYEPVTSDQIPAIRAMSSRELLQALAVPRWKLPCFLHRFRQEVRCLLPALYPIDGMKDALLALHKRGDLLGIVTSNSQNTVEIFLRSQGMDDWFEFIHGGQVLLGKTHTLKQLPRKYKVHPTQVIYVGDETRDIEAAQKAKIQVIAVSWGVNNGQVLAQQQPNALIDHPEQLLAAIQII